MHQREILPLSEKKSSIQQWRKWTTIYKGIPLQTTSTFPISDRNIPVDILEDIEFPVPNSP